MRPSDLHLPEKFTTFRNRQIETAAKINASPKFTYMLDAPTGSGKSLIAATVQRLMKKNICYVCTTKQLQDQLLRDFPYAATVKGRNNYVCLRYPKMYPDITAEECNHSDTAKCPYYAKCPYILAKKAARAAPIGVLNTAYYLSEVNFVGMFKNYDLLVIDEFDTLEDQLMSHVEVVITKRQLERLNYPPPKYKTKFESWVEWARPALTKFSAELRQMEKELENRDAWSTDDLGEIRRKRDVGRLVTKLSFFVREVDQNWIWLPGDDKWVFKPVWVAKYANNAVWKHADKVLGMSATVLDPRQMSLNVGLNLSGRTFEYLQMASPFPKENRPVYYEPCADVTRKNMDIALPMLAKSIQGILDKHPGEKILCFPPGTLVTTSNGYKPIEEIRVGDSVLTHKGNYKPVRALHSREYKGLLKKIRPVGSLGFACTTDHPIAVYLTRDKCSEWVPADDIWENSFLFTPVIKSPPPIPEIRILLGPRALYDELNVNTYGFWYIVGEWLAEGFVGSSNQVRWSAPHRWQSSKIIDNAREARLHAWWSSSTQCVITTCKELQLWLVDTFGKGARNKRVPAWILSLPEEYRKALYEGYNDGDGCRTQPGCIEKWGSVSDSLALGIRDVSRSLGFLPTSYRTSQGIYCSVNEGKPAQYSREQLYTSVRSTKYDEYIGKVYNLEVEEDESYVLDLVAVHNCHTVSYKIRDFLVGRLDQKRILTHSTADRAAKLEEFKRSEKPLVLISPSMDRGVDLPEEECRVVVIAKIPYPDLGDLQVSRRVHASKDGNNWYAHKTVSSIVQMSGRGVRSETDYAATYILDRQFERVYKEHKGMFPQWFKEAVIM